jgi:hypothetical protein
MRPIALLAGLALAAAAGPMALAATAPPRRATPDPLAVLLADDWSEATRATVREAVREIGGAGCATLSGYAAAPDSRVREHAVRALEDAACDRLEDYRPFFGDRAPWVVDAVLEAVGVRRLAAAWPFALEHVDDRRRLVSDSGSWTIEEAAHRTLRRLTGQPIPFDPDGLQVARDRAAAAWRAFFAAHGAEAPAAWNAAGLQAARAALAGGDEAGRIAALETLALAGGPGIGALRDALLRAPGEIEAQVVCEPDGPPRVTEEVPCTLVIRNVTARRIPLALGEAGLTLATVTDAPPPPAKPKSAGKRGTAGGAAKGVTAPPPGPRVESGPPAPPPSLWDFVDLAPGGTIARPLRAGPVMTAGRYEVRAAVPDLSVTLPGADGTRLARIEAVTVLRFEQ